MTEQARRMAPDYHEYYGLPLKVVPGTDGAVEVWRISTDTGGWERGKESLVIELESHSLGEHFVLDRESFIELTESVRARYLSGEGPVFAVYATIKAMQARAEAESRPLTSTERGIIRRLHRKTYAMFERELAERGEPGADPAPES